MIKFDELVISDVKTFFLLKHLIYSLSRCRHIQIAYHDKTVFHPVYLTSKCLEFRCVDLIVNSCHFCRYFCIVITVGNKIAHIVQPFQSIPLTFCNMEAFSLNSGFKSLHFLVVCNKEIRFHNFRFQNLCRNFCSDLFLLHSFAVKSKLTCNTEKVLFPVGHKEIFYCRISPAACRYFRSFCNTCCYLHCCCNIFCCFRCFRFCLNCFDAFFLRCFHPVWIILTFYFFYNGRSFCCSFFFFLNVNSVLRNFLVSTVLTESKPFLGIHKFCSLCLTCI